MERLKVMEGNLNFMELIDVDKMIESAALRDNLLKEMKVEQNSKYALMQS